MNHSSITMSESARHWGALWGDRPRAWARNEEQQTPVYEQALRDVGLEPGDAVLDAGCGTGVFLRLCADRGAHVTGIDASEGLLEIARERVPEADLRLGDLQTLPYADDAFDLVTGFTSFFFAEDMVAALREAGRVARPGRADRDPGLRPPGALRPRGDEGGRGHVPRRGPPVVLAAGDRRGTRLAGRADRGARVRLARGRTRIRTSDAGRAHARGRRRRLHRRARARRRDARRDPRCARATAGSRTAATACPTSGTW